MSGIMPFYHVLWRFFMKELIISKWDDILEFLRTQYDITRISFDMWLKGLKFKDMVDNKVILYFEDSDMGNNNISFIKKRYSSFIKNAIAGFGDGNVGAELLVHLVDTAGRIVTFRNHAHLELGYTHG